MDSPVFSVRFYLLVFAGLLLLTGLTIGLSTIELGPAHLRLGLTIATLKAVLVFLFFMHVVRAGSLIWLVAAGGMFWLGILLTLTLTDYLTR